MPHRDFYRALSAAGVLLTIVIAAALYNPSLIPGMAPRNQAPYALKGDLSDNALRTGSLLIVPEKGNLCQHRTIDNLTWIIRDNGTASCDELMSRGADQPSREFSTPRLDAIRNGFRKTAR